MPSPPRPARGDRRPIAARQWGIIRSLASAMARRGVAPNAISIGGLVAASLAGAMLAWTNHAGAPVAPLLVAAAALVQLRLLANLLDGMVAVEGKLGSPVGAIYNELPDRVSDSAVLIGAGYAMGSDPTLGWAAALLAMLVTNIRLLSAGLALPADFGGPMAKQQRMAVVTIACLVAALFPIARSWETTAPGFSPRTGAFAVALAVVILGCVITAVRRTVRMATQLA